MEQGSQNFNTQQLGEGKGLVWDWGCWSEGQATPGLEGVQGPKAEALGQGSRKGSDLGSG